MNFSGGATSNVSTAKRLKTDDGYVDLVGNTGAVGEVLEILTNTGGVGTAQWTAPTSGGGSADDLNTTGTAVNVSSSAPPGGAGEVLVATGTTTATWQGTASLALGGGSSAGTDATAIGKSSTASGGSSTALGDSATASGFSSIASGPSSNASGTNALAFGISATASNPSAAAYGPTATASGVSSTAVGSLASASGLNSTALGANADATHATASAFGSISEAKAASAAAFGAGSRALGTNSLAGGPLSLADGSDTTALGSASDAGGQSATALGHDADAAGDLSLAAGYNADAQTLDATALGPNTVASGNYATAGGSGAVASGLDSTAYGRLSFASATEATAVGRNARAQFSGVTSVGANSGLSSAVDATQLGSGAQAQGARSIALGHDALATLDDSFVVKSLREDQGTTGVVYNISTHEISRSDIAVGAKRFLAAGTIDPNVAHNIFAANEAGTTYILSDGSTVPSTIRLTNAQTDVVKITNNGYTYYMSPGSYFFRWDPTYEKWLVNEQHAFQPVLRDPFLRTLQITQATLGANKYQFFQYCASDDGRQVVESANISGGRWPGVYSLNTVTNFYNYNGTVPASGRPLSEQPGLDCQMSGNGQWLAFGYVGSGASYMSFYEYVGSSWVHRQDFQPSPAGNIARNMAFNYEGTLFTCCYASTLVVVKLVGGTWTQAHQLTHSGSVILGCTSLDKNTGNFVGISDGSAGVGEIDIWDISTGTPQALPPLVPESYSGVPNFGSKFHLRTIDRHLYAFIGGPGNDEGGTDKGAFWIYRFTGGVWEEVLYFPNKYLTGQFFGSSVSVSGQDANLIAVGEANNNYGALVFERHGETVRVVGIEQVLPVRNGLQDILITSSNHLLVGDPTRNSNEGGIWFYNPWTPP